MNNELTNTGKLIEQIRAAANAGETVEDRNIYKAFGRENVMKVRALSLDELVTEYALIHEKRSPLSSRMRELITIRVRGLIKSADIQVITDDEERPEGMIEINIDDAKRN